MLSLRLLMVAYSKDYIEGKWLLNHEIEIV